MNIEAVNELIASLESAGELSIREQKFLKLAKAFKQLESENVQIKAMNDCLSEELRGYESDGAFDGPKMHLLWWQVETPATDRIVAGIKAEAKSHDLNAFISHYSAELDNHIANGGDQFDERAVRLRGVIVGARMFREKLRDEEKALALREGDGK
ncbi:hypothetical protein ACTVQ6_15580 [Klebsiella pneumoniae]|uniref:hypothetical protein n=1 Tax=Klebsiella pneumoniae TaxID=573 RepID=UPI000E2E09B6|nr:hypothetical protein [Klebsiella pneumoniae]MCE0213893.1 hypothetical protein [Klebsiella pneumoniae]MCP6103254.1 hypothetical protein [Klebsiella pneumoniae]MCP6257836.1 hypothetical protein [Klebsiella pneumoniae]MCP6743952.1 hypothetical protein [Klebsiella pneumoniae]MDN2648225.1 hypothetical protein [Klebsiella pneumoniae]